MTVASSLQALGSQVDGHVSGRLGGWGDVLQIQIILLVGIKVSVVLRVSLFQRVKLYQKAL